MPEDPMTVMNGHDRVRAVQWQGDHLRLLDQRLLPQHEAWIECRTAREVAGAIRDLAVRGAPAIGLAAAWGAVLAARSGMAGFGTELAMLRRARPTAVNLMWALDRMAAAAHAGRDLAVEAQTIQ